MGGIETMVAAIGADWATRLPRPRLGPTWPRACRGRDWGRLGHALAAAAIGADLATRLPRPQPTWPRACRDWGRLGHALAAAEQEAARRFSSPCGDRLGRA